MNNKGYVLKKQGNIFIPIGLVALVIIFATVFLVYYQVNIITENIRRDLFYASNNAILSFDLQDLAYKKYTANEQKAKQVIEYLLNKNYTETQGSITGIKVTNLKMIYEKDKVILDVEIQVKFKSVINIAGKNEHSFKMKDKIKISLMDYQIGE